MTGSRPTLFLFAAVVSTSTMALVWRSSPVPARVVGGARLAADVVACDLSQYKSSAGLTAAMDQNGLNVV